MLPFMRSLFLLTLLSSFMARGQYFRVNPEFYDSHSPTSFSFHISGLAAFNDSMVVSVELTTPDSLRTVLFSGIQNFTHPAASTLTGFTYDAATEAFSAQLGSFPTTHMYLWLRSSVAGVIREEILVTQFDPPSHAE